MNLEYRRKQGREEIVDKLRQIVLLRTIKLTNVFLEAVPFALCWYGYYANRIVMPFSRSKSFESITRS